MGVAALPTWLAEPIATIIRIEVRFSVKEFDPKNPKEGVLECVVNNGTYKPISAPNGYSTGFDSDVVVFGGSGREKKVTEGVSYWHELRLVRGWNIPGKEAKTEFTIVAPREEKVIFKASLNELLIERKESAWTWQA